MGPFASGTKDTQHVLREVDMHAAHLLSRRAHLTPNREALTELVTGKRYTYSELNTRANRLANWMREELGVQKGDRVSILAQNGVAYVDLLYGLAKIGEDELMDADVNLEAILAEEFARALGEEEDKQFILGTGHDYEMPEGITINTTLVANTKTTAAAGAITVEDMLDVLYECPTQYRRNGAFMVNSLTELALRKLRSRGGDESGDCGKRPCCCRCCWCSCDGHSSRES